MEEWAADRFSTEKEMNRCMGACQAIVDVVNLDYNTLTGQQEEENA